MKLYRYVDREVEHTNPLPDASPTYVEMILLEFPVLRQTAQGFWIHVPGKDTNTFVLRHSSGAKRRFAYQSIPLALKSFIIRKQRQIEHNERAMANAKMALVQATREQIKLLERVQEAA